jgi:hypothetical protein
MAIAGYSGTPLAKKLGIAQGCRVFVKDAPQHYRELLAPMPSGVTFDRVLSAETDIAHLFCSSRTSLQKQLHEARKLLKPDGMLWISWPKKASKVATDITEGTIRELALPLGFVDVKVCAVDEVWSGLKLVIRKQLR